MVLVLKNKQLPSINLSDEEILSMVNSFQAGDLLAAKKKAISITKLFPDYPTSWKILGAIYQQSEEFDLALLAKQKSVLIDPEDFENHYNLGNLLKNIGDFELAKKSYKKTLELQPDHYQSYFNLGHIAHNLGDLGEAETYYLKSIELNPNSLDSYNNLGLILKSCNMYKEAIINFKKALSINSNFADSEINLGITQQIMGDIDSASLSFKNVLTYNPRSYLSLFYLHTTYYRNMKLDLKKGIECLERAFNIEPYNNLVTFFLGVLSYYNGNKELSDFYHSNLDKKNPLVFAQIDSWNWIKKSTSKLPLLFWEKNDGFEFAFKSTIKNGLILEFGVASGQSINKLATMTNQNIHGFDTFKGLTENWNHLSKGAFDNDGVPPKAPNHVKFHVGLFEETLPSFMNKNKSAIKFLNIDCDLYSSTKTIFKFLGDRVTSGTIIFFDEYFGYKGWKNHEFKAFQEAAKIYSWSYEYLAINIYRQQVVIKIL